MSPRNAPHGAASRFPVEVVFARAEQVHSSTVWVSTGATVFQAVAGSGVLQRLSGEDAAAISFGIFGDAVDGRRPVAAGDRIELLRPLRVDPKEARRRRARLRRAPAPPALSSRETD